MYFPQKNSYFYDNKGAGFEYTQTAEVPPGESKVAKVAHRSM